MPGTRVPFPYIDSFKKAGVPTQAVRELERDFLWIEGQLGGASGTSLYDAIIDPGNPTDAGQHRYINLTDLLANESWSSTYFFTVGVIGRPGTPIEDSSFESVPGPLTLMALGYSMSGFAFMADESRPIWQLDGQFNLSAQGIALIGLQLERTSDGASSIPYFDNGPVYAEKCVIFGSNPANLSQQFVTRLVESEAVYGTDTMFVDILFNNLLIASDCHYFARVTGTRTLFTSSVTWTGGTWTQGDSAATAGTCRYQMTGNNAEIFIDITRDAGRAFGQTGGGVPDFEFTGNNQNVDFNFRSVDNHARVLVANSVRGLTLRGTFVDIEINTDFSDASKTRFIDATVTNSAYVIGPAQVTLQVVGATASPAVELLGQGMTADIVVASGNATHPTPALQFTGLDDSLVRAALTQINPSPGTTKPYDIDAASDRSILIVTGSNVGWGVAGTNASGTTIVRDETSL